MKRIERARNWTRQHLRLFRCPVCSAPCADVSGNSLICENGHATDFNRHGYLYFLRKPANDEYDTALFEARRKLIQAGMFLPIMKEIARQLPSSPQTILDVGTGEGSPLCQLLSQRADSGDTAIGFDISRAGIALAAQLPLDALFCVANLRELPFANASFTVVTELFSPSDYREFDRVLAPHGLLIKVIPGPQHLRELRALLFPEDDDRRFYDNSSVRNLFEAHYPKAKEMPLCYEFSVPVDLRCDLMRMSPLQWGASARVPNTEELKKLDSVTIDALILIGAASSEAPSSDSAS
jgi:23S rRNA (guanine745-N1)-methyltransferase